MNAPEHSSIQQPLDALPHRTWDVIVAGAGPAGSICARRLAERGRAVLMLDREHFPRHKVCGDLLITDSLNLLRKVGLYDRIAGVAHLSHAIDVYSPGGRHLSVSADFLTLKRLRLDYELASCAVESGAVFARANVIAVDGPSEDSPSRIVISESDQPLVARIVVFATGAVVDAAARDGLVADRHPSAVAIRCYVTSSHCVENTIIAYDRSIIPGYGWIIPLGPTDDGRYVYNVGCGTSYRFVNDGHHHLKRTLTTFLEEFGPARKVMAAGGVRGKIAGASLRCGLPDIERAVGDHRLLIGESAGTTYPFSGEGIGKAMETGLAAADTIADAFESGDLSRLGPYRDHLRRLKPRYQGYETAEKWLGNRRLNDYVAGRIVRSPYLRNLVDELVAETSDPGSLFKLSSLVKSYWK